MSATTASAAHANGSAKATLRQKTPSVREAARLCREDLSAPNVGRLAASMMLDALEPEPEIGDKAAVRSDRHARTLLRAAEYTQRHGDNLIVSAAAQSSPTEEDTLRAEQAALTARLEQISERLCGHSGN